MHITKAQEEHALELHKRSIVIDFHCDVILSTLPDAAFTTNTGKKRALSERSTEGHVDIPRLFEGGVGCQVFAHFVEPIYNQVAPQRMLQLMGYFLSELEKNYDKIQLVTHAEEIYKNQGKKVSIIMGIEGGEAIGQDLRILKVYHKLGLRTLTLCWNNRNAIADGARQQRSKGGLTEFGVSVVEECNRLGIIVDVSHLSDPGFWDVLDVSHDPVIASHSNCRFLCPSMRNLSDEMIKALSDRGGVMGINLGYFFLIEQKEVLAGRIPTIDTVIEHIDHIAQVTGGVDNIGLGSDYDGFPNMARGLEDVSKLPNLTKALVARGYSDQDIEKIMGGNFLRVIKEVWK